MKKIFAALLFTIIIICVIIYFRTPLTKDKFLTKYDLYSDYQKALAEINKSDTQKDDLLDFEKSIETIINSPFNIEYKIANLKELFDGNIYIWNEINREFIPQLAVKYDYPNTIKYLEQKKTKSLSDAFQLMVLYQIYKPNKVNTKSYKDLYKSEKYIKSPFTKEQQSYLLPLLTNKN